MTWSIYHPPGDPDPELLWDDSTGQAYVDIDVAAFNPDLTAAYDALVDAVRDADRLTVARQALEAIAEHDPLLEANDAVFGLHAARRMQAQARKALDLLAGEAIDAG